MGVIRPINQGLADNFLKRSLDNCDWVKDLSEKELDARIQELDPAPKFSFQLRKEQKAMFLLGVMYPGFLFLADLGIGKTGLSLSLISYYQQIGNVKKALVLVPNLVLIQSWVDEINKLTPDLNYIGVYGQKKERLQLLEQDANVYILNYAGLQAVLNTGKGSKKVITPASIGEFAQRFDMVVYDEIVAVKNPQSLTFKICDRLSQLVPYKYGLTGRPFGRHIEDLWAEFKVIDDGATLSTSFWFFRSVFFKPVQKPWATEWKFRTKLTDKLHEVIKNRSIRYRLENVSYTPVHSVLRVNLPVETITYVQTVLQNLKASLAVHKTEDVKASFTKLRQIASGFLNYTTEEKTAERIVFPDNPKLDLLIEKLEELPEGCKALVFQDFIFSGEQISARLKQAKIEHRWIYGGTLPKEKIQNMLDFKNNPDVTVLVINSASGAMGLNLQVANFVFYYESPVSPQVRDQATGRVARSGQTKTVYEYDLVVKDSVEEKILEFLKEGKDLLDELIEGRTMM